jgi:hypothetical protein
MVIMDDTEFITRTEFNGKFHSIAMQKFHKKKKKKKLNYEGTVNVIILLYAVFSREHNILYTLIKLLL